MLSVLACGQAFGRSISLDLRAPTARAASTKAARATAASPQAEAPLRASALAAGVADVGDVSGVPLVVNFKSLGDAIGVAGVTWKNDPSLPWTFGTGDDGNVGIIGGKDPSLASGVRTTTLTASVSGPGVFSFDIDVFSQAEGDALSFYVNGEKKNQWSWTYNATTNIAVTTGGTTTFEWRYDYSPVNLDSYYGVFLKGVSWKPSAPPAVATGLKASQGAYSIGTLLRWKEVAFANSYVVYRGTTDNVSTSVRIGETKQSRYWDTTGKYGEVYYYWIAAANEFGEGARTRPVTGFRTGEYTVKFNANGGKLPKGKKMAAQTLTYGKAAKLRKNVFTKKGKVAYKDKSKVRNLVITGKTVKLYAVWKK